MGEYHDPYQAFNIHTHTHTLYIILTARVWECVIYCCFDIFSQLVTIQFPLNLLATRVLLREFNNKRTIWENTEHSHDVEIFKKKIRLQYIYIYIFEVVKNYLRRYIRTTIIIIHISIHSLDVVFLIHNMSILVVCSNSTNGEWADSLQKKGQNSLRQQDSPPLLKNTGVVDALPNPNLRNLRGGRKKKKKKKEIVSYATYNIYPILHSTPPDI